MKKKKRRKNGMGEENLKKYNFYLKFFRK